MRQGSRRCRPTNSRCPRTRATVSKDETALGRRSCGLGQRLVIGGTSGQVARVAQRARLPHPARRTRSPRRRPTPDLTADTGTGSGTAGTGPAAAAPAAGRRYGADTDTPEQIASDQAEIDTAEAQLTSAQQSLNEATLTSPDHRDGGLGGHQRRRHGERRLEHRDHHDHRDQRPTRRRRRSTARRSPRSRSASPPRSRWTASTATLTARCPRSDPCSRAHRATPTPSSWHCPATATACSPGSSGQHHHLDGIGVQRGRRAHLGRADGWARSLRARARQGRA